MRFLSQSLMTESNVDYRISSDPRLLTEIRHVGMHCRQAELCDLHRPNIEISRIRALTASSAVSVVNAKYALTDNIVGNGFYDAFDWKAVPDPTNGRVSYVDQPTSKSENLTSAASDTFILRSDFIKSSQDHALLFLSPSYGVRHVPTGCGTWPAIWETDPSIYGKIDIAEGVNSEVQNTATFWTDQDSSSTSSAMHSHFGSLQSINEAKSERSKHKKSFGVAFNQNGGGWYAMERTSACVKIWFWERSNGSVPAEMKNGGNSVNPDAWGAPFAHMTNEHFYIEKILKAHNLINFLTFYLLLIYYFLF
ncbi:hypothetical protein CPB83DRAFT_906319 [Crepidotus variabilis]|uniref:Uncharacterized protein n=1 Tax=Crepidotus variabilis TaxID=179855 RepID=A0A9P6JR11_9AGAR|nr:hypothetical protein CPB83DRAFT_906319 [Crepidotus variabilis]